MKTLQEILHARASGKDSRAAHAVVDVQGGRVRLLMGAIGDHARVVLNVEGNDVTILSPSDLYRSPNEQADAEADRLRRSMTSDNIAPGTNLAPNAFALGAKETAPEGADADDDGGSGADDMLLGSNVLPAMIEIAPGNEAQLGAVVSRAHKESGLSVADWNALPNEDRETRLAATVDAMRAEAASPASIDHTAFAKDALLEIAATEKVEGVTQAMNKREIAEAINRKRAEAASK